MDRDLKDVENEIKELFEAKGNALFNKEKLLKMK